MQYGRRTEGTTCWGNGRAGRAAFSSLRSAWGRTCALLPFSSLRSAPLLVPALCSSSRPCALRGDAILPPLCGGRTRAGGSEAEHGSDAEHRNQDKVRKFEYRSTNIEEVLSLGHLDLLSVTVSNFGFRISNFYPILVPPLCGGRTRAGGSEAEHGSDAEHRNQDKVRKFEYRSTNIEEVLSLGHLDLLSVTVSNFGFRISNFYPILVPPLCGGTHLR